jgi:four helix bundle protein
MNSEEYLEINKNINRGFRKLVVWQEAVRLYSFVDDLISKTKNTSYKVKAQVEDSIFSVSSNIAEGYCRRSIKENIQFINIALSSLGENYSQVFTLFNAHKISEELYNKYDKLHYSLENKLLSFNKSMINKLTNDSDWKNDYKIREMIFKYENEE